MLILQISPRVINVHGAPSFPCEARIEAELLPGELFGMAPFSGKLPLGRGGLQVQLRPDPVDGGIVFDVRGRLDATSFEQTFAGMKLAVSNGHLTASWTCTSLDNLRDCITKLDLAVASVLAAAVPSPVRLGELTGTVGAAGVTYECRGTTERAFYSVSGPLLAADFATRLGEFDAASAAPNAQLLTSAYRYLLQTRRLGYVSDHSTEFIAERLLNLYKAIEVLFGRNARDLRRDLTALGVAEDVIEGIFVALLYVRDELDVGHPAVRTLEKADWERIHAFAEKAEDGVTWLLAKLTRAVRDGRFTLRSTPGGTSKRSKLLETIAARPDVRVKAYGPGEWRDQKVH